VTGASCRACGAPVPDASGLCESCAALTNTFVVAPPAEPSTDPRLSELEGGAAVSMFGPGQSFADRYTIVERIGDGGMGEVYKAIDRRRQGRTVALKLIRARLAQRGDALQRFRRELDLAQKVSHPNVCRLHDLGEVGGQLYISMEYVDGQTLDDLIRTMGRLSPLQTASLGRQICAGLRAVHEQGIVHRDLKPSNVMVDRSGHALVMDFGMAYHPGAEKLTRAGMVVGTLAYVAPEQARGTGTDTRSDVYALGLLLYEMLTGRRPPGDGVPLPLALRDAGETCPPPSHFAAEVHEVLDSVVMRCLSREPAARFGSMAEVSDALARASDVFGTTLAPLPASLPEAVTTLQRARSTRLRSLSAVLGAVLVGALLFTLARRPPGPPVSIALLPLTYAGPPEHTNLGELVPLFLSDALRVRSGSRVAPFSSSRTFTPNEDAASVQRQLNVGFVVQGQVTVEGEHARTVLRLQGAPPGGGQSREFAGRTDDPLAVSDAMADWITAAAGLTGPAPTPPSAGRRQAMEPYLRGRAYLEGWDVERNYARAEEAFRRTIELDPSFAQAHAGLALALVSDYQETLAPDLVPQAARAAEQAASLAPELPEPRLALGVVQLVRGQSAEAAATLQQAADLAIANDEVARRIGQAYADNGRKADAERFLRRAIALRPDYWENYNALGRFLAGQGRYEDAKAPFREVMRLRPKSDTGYTNLAGMHLYRGERDLAEPLLKESIRIQPTAQAHNFLGMVHYATGRFAEAAEQFEAASRSGSEHLAYKGNLGDAYRQLGRRKEADAAYAEAILTGRRQLEVNPKDSDARAGLGMFLAGSRRCTDARQEIAQALRVEPDRPTVSYYAAVAYAICGDEPLAAEQAVRAIQGGMIDVATNPDLKPLLNEPRVRKALAAAGGR
jgi:serine/threonine protein kinase/Flp pilus assembly protein TadD